MPGSLDYNAQAAALKDLALARRRLAGTPRGSAVIIVGAAEMCGATTLAVNLAATLAATEPSPVAVLDALGNGGPCEALGLEPTTTLDDVVREGAPVARALTHGPEGLWVVAAGGVLGRRDELTPWQRRRLDQAIREIAERVGFVVAETTPAAAPLLAPLGQVAVVAAPWAVVEAYSALKMCAERVEGSRLGLVVCRAATRLEATKTANAIIGVAARRLGFQPASLGFVADDPYVVTAAQERALFALAYPRCQASRCLKSIAARLRAGGQAAAGPASPAESRPPRQMGRRN